LSASTQGEALRDASLSLEELHETSCLHYPFTALTPGAWNAGFPAHKAKNVNELTLIGIFQGQFSGRAIDSSFISKA
jgi:hypothetical protein